MNGPLSVPVVNFLSKAEAAVAYAEAGWRVGALWWIKPDGTCACETKCTKPGKHPIGRPGYLLHGKKDFTTNVNVVRGWWSNPLFGNANVGILPDTDDDGRIYSALDIDDPTKWAEAGVDLPVSGPCQLTGSGNKRRHHLYWWPAGSDLRLNGPLPGTGAEMKGGGLGYIVVEPSATVGPYLWKRAGVVPEAPAELTAILAREPVTTDTDGDCCAIPEAIGRDPGGHDWLLARAGHMRGNHGNPPSVIRAHLIDCLPAMRPPYAPGEGERIVDGILEYDEKHPERIPPGGRIILTNSGPVQEVEVEAAAAWPEPPDEAAYCGLAGDLVRAVADITEADPVALLGTTLAIFGVLAGPGCGIYQGSMQKPNLYVVLVGETGHSRKGTSLTSARAVFDQAYPGYDQLFVPGLGSGEGLIKHLSGSEEHTADPRALLLETEFGRFLTAMCREGSTISPIVRDAWDGTPIGRFLARSTALVTRHHVGLLAHTTPSELAAKLQGNEAANGFGNRILWLAVRRTKRLASPPNPAPYVSGYVRALHEAIVEAQPPRELAFSDEAADRWGVLYDQIAERHPFGLAGALTARAEAQTARLALVYALMDRSETVGLPHLEAAIALEAYEERSVNSIFGRSTGNPNADELWHMLKDGPVPWLSIRQSLGLRMTAEVTAVVRVLTDLGLAELVRERRAGETPGRPTRTLRLKGAAQ